MAFSASGKVQRSMAIWFLALGEFVFNKALRNMSIERQGFLGNGLQNATEELREIWLIVICCCKIFGQYINPVTINKNNSFNMAENNKAQTEKANTVNKQEYSD